MNILELKGCNVGRAVEEEWLAMAAILTELSFCSEWFKGRVFSLFQSLPNTLLWLLEVQCSFLSHDRPQLDIGQWMFQ